MKTLLQSRLEDEVSLEFYDPVSFFKMGGKPYTLIDLGDISLIALGFRDLSFAQQYYKDCVESLVFVGETKILVDFLKAYSIKGKYTNVDLQSILNKDLVILDEVDFTIDYKEIMWFGQDKIFLHIKDAVVKLTEFEMSDEFIDFLKKYEKFPDSSS